MRKRTVSQAGFTTATIIGGIMLVGVLLATTGNSMMTMMKKESQINSLTVTKERMRTTMQMLAVHQNPNPGDDPDYAGEIDGYPYAPRPDSNLKISASVGAPTSDGWGNPFKYCVWQHTRDAMHFPAAMMDGKLHGAYGSYDAVKAYFLLALISGGPDGVVGSDCATHVQQCDDTGKCTMNLTTTARSGTAADDIIKAIPTFEWDMIAVDTYTSTSSLPAQGATCNTKTEKLHWDGTGWNCVPAASPDEIAYILSCNAQGQVWHEGTQHCISASSTPTTDRASMNTFQRLMLAEKFMSPQMNTLRDTAMLDRIHPDSLFSTQNCLSSLSFISIGSFCSKNNSSLYEPKFFNNEYSVRALSLSAYNGLNGNEARIGTNKEFLLRMDSNTYNALPNKTRLLMITGLLDQGRPEGDDECTATTGEWVAGIHFEAKQSTTGNVEKIIPRVLTNSNHKVGAGWCWSQIAMTVPFQKSLGNHLYLTLRENACGQQCVGLRFIWGQYHDYWRTHGWWEEK